MYQFGGQFRHYPRAFGNIGIWYGGELSYARFTSVYDYDEWYDKPPRAGGFTFGGMLGYRLPCDKLPVNAYENLSLINYGDFKTNDMVIDQSATGFTFRV